MSRALSNNPKILLLDEPTGDLDTKATDLVMKILLDLNIHKKITMVANKSLKIIIFSEEEEEGVEEHLLRYSYELKHSE